MAARRRRKQAEPASRGLAATEVAEAEGPGLADLETRVAEAEGAVLARYRDPWGGAPLLLAALPVAAVAPTPFQRDLSQTHARRLEEVISRVGTYLDPVVAVPAPEGAEAAFWTPNGFHRLSALRRLGARTVTALLSPDPALAYRILALNTEKAHNLKERALEAVRMARGLAEADPQRPESDYALELEDGSLVTLGFAYEQRPRLAGGAYAPALRQADAFLEEPIARALEVRSERAARLLAIDERVAEIVATLVERGFDSPYLKNFVVARIRPFRGRGRQAPDPDTLLERMAEKADAFDPGRVRPDQVSRAGGGGEA